MLGTNGKTYPKKRISENMRKLANFKKGYRISLKEHWLEHLTVLKNSYRKDKFRRKKV